jgi:hypothetical protein
MNKITSILNNNITEIDKLLDMLDLLINVFDEYAHKDNYYDGKSILKDLFEFYAYMSMKYEV